MTKLALNIDLFEGSNLKGLAGSGEFEDPIGDPATLLEKLISGIIGLATIIAFIWFVFLVISGGLGIMFSAGDKNAVATGTKKITNGLIGIIIIILALVIIRALSVILGLTDVPFLNPGEFIKNFSLK